MDTTDLRGHLRQLQEHGALIVSQIEGREAGEKDAAEASRLLSALVARVDETLSRLEASEKRAKDTLRALRRFCDVLSPAAEIEALMERHRRDAADQLDRSADVTQESAKPYRLFVTLADDPDAELSDEEIDAVSDFFGARIMRPLHQGKFTFPEATAKETPQAEAAKPAAPQAEANARVSPSPTTESPAPLGEGTLAQAPARPSKLTITTEKEDTPLGTKKFLSDYTFATPGSRSKAAIYEHKTGELHMLHAFAKLGALTRRHIKDFFVEGSPEENLSKLLKNGYVSVLKHEAFEAEFFALSRKGAEIFKRDKIREMMHVVQKITAPIWEVEALEGLETDVRAYERLLSVAIYVVRVALKAAKPARFRRIGEDEGDACLVAEMDYEQGDVVRRCLLEFRSAEGGVVINTEDTLAYFCKTPQDGDAVEIRDADGALVDSATLLAALFPAGPETEDEADAEAAEVPAPEAAEAPTVIARRILEAESLPAEQAPFVRLTRALLCKAAEPEPGNTDCIGRAVLLQKTLSVAEEAIYGDSYQRLLLAADLPLDERNYTQETLVARFSGQEEGTAAHLAALLRALFRPDSAFDFQLYTYAEKLLREYDDVFSGFPDLKPTFNTFAEIHSALRGGFTERMTARSIDARTKGAELSQLATLAGASTLPYISQRVKGIPELLTECFGADSMLGMCTAAIAARKTDARQDILDCYARFLDADRISKEKVAAAINENYRIVRNNYKSGHIVDNIIGAAFGKIADAFHERLKLMGRWLDLTDEEPEEELGRLPQIAAKVMGAIEDAIAALAASETVSGADRGLLRHALLGLSAKLSGKPDLGFDPKDWLSSGIFPFVSGAPVVDRRFCDIRYYEPWRNALRHIAGAPEAFPAVLERIGTQPDDALYDNLGQAIAICEHLGDSDQADLFRKSIPAAKKSAEKWLASHLNDRREIDYAYGRIDEATKENIDAALEGLTPVFFEAANFAEFRSFAKALRRALDEVVRRNLAAWADAIQARRGKGREDLLARAERYLSSDNANLILVEDALNDFDSGTTREADFTAPEDDLFAEFIEGDTYGDLWRVCWEQRGNAFRDFAPAYAEEMVTKAGRTTQYRNSAKALVSSLPNTPQIDGAEGIRTLLRGIGFKVSGVTRDRAAASQGSAKFEATVEQEAKNRPSYRHPIAEMGTRLPKNLTVIELFGTVEPETILRAVREANPHHTPLVLVNGPLQLAARRQLARLFFRDDNRSPFILVDWVLLLHLATKIEDDRMATMLACALPYTGAMQLFSRTSTTQVADEMFIGRNDELDKILDMNGPVIVYGGRQLGKTALLQRAKNRFHMPAEGDYSAFVDVRTCRDEKAFVDRLREGLASAGIDLAKTDTVEGVCKALRAWFRQGGRRLLLLIDESDLLLSELAGVKYAPLTAFENLCKVTDAKFKFVFAGLHNVFLAARDDNCVFGHFGQPLCIRPMSRADAYRLLSRPLRYLGFVPDPDMLLRLLVTTNFYPGIIHLVGAELIDMLKTGYAEHYNERKNPPYALAEDQIGRVMGSVALTRDIEEKIRITLAVDPDYLAIARCVAMLYYFEEEKRKWGYAPEEILQYTAQSPKESLRAMRRDKCEQLLRELCDMSILVENDGRYRFRLSRFLSIIGKKGDDVLEQLFAEEEACHEA